VLSSLAVSIRRCSPTPPGCEAVSELVLSVLLIADFVFIASAGSKLRSRIAFRSFRAGLRATALVPEHRLPAIAAGLAAGEAVSALLLTAAAAMVVAGATGATAMAVLALAAATLLFVVLTAGVALVLRRGISARCACFGASSGMPLGRVHALRNLTMLVLLTAGLALCPLAHRPPAAGAAVAVLAGVVVASLIIRWEDLATLIAPLPASPR
jgi:hypothetical protein